MVEHDPRSPARWAAETRAEQRRRVDAERFAELEAVNPDFELAKREARAIVEMLAAKKEGKR